MLFRKKTKAAPLSPAEAADGLYRAVNDAIDRAERAHVGLPAIMTVLSQAVDTLKYRNAVSAPSSYSYARTIEKIGA